MIGFGAELDDPSVVGVGHAEARVSETCGCEHDWLLPLLVGLVLGLLVRR